MSCQNRDMKNMHSYCRPLRTERTQFDKELQNMWCPNCCGPTGPQANVPSPNRSRYTSAKEEKDFRGNVKVSGVY